MNNIVVSGSNLTIEDVVNVARNNYKVELSQDAVRRINRARYLVDKFIEKERVYYGITTGFGKFSDAVISKDDSANIQRNLIISYSCGV